MKVVRIYTGADNQTHFEELPLETFATLSAQVGTGPVRLNQGPAKSVIGFSQCPAPSVCGHDVWADGNRDW